MWCGASTKFISFTFKHFSINSQHLSPAGVSTVVHALSFCRTGITVLLFFLIYFPKFFLIYVAPKYLVSRNCFCKCRGVCSCMNRTCCSSEAGRKVWPSSLQVWPSRGRELLHPWFVLVLSVWRKVEHLSEAFESHGAVAGFWIQCQQGRQCLWGVSQAGTLCAVRLLWQAGHSQRVCLLWETQHI